MGTKLAQTKERTGSVEPTPATPPHSLVVESRKSSKEALQASPQLISQVLRPGEFTDENCGEIADFFRQIFNNDWADYAVCPPCDSTLPDGMRLSAKEVYGTDGHVPMEMMDNNPLLPDCTNCHQQMQIFHDPKATREKMIRKLTPDGYASLLRDAETNNVAGFGFCYGTTLKEGFNFEWGNPYNYMTNPDPEYDRDFNRFLSILNAGVEDYHFEPDTEILLWNCVAISKKARGSKNFLGLMRNMFNALPPEKRKLRIVGECMQGTVAHGLFHTVGGHDVPGFLAGDNTIITLKVGETIDLFNLPDEVFSERHKATVAKLRHG